ncbi:MAG: tetratricopeptide repeat protein, partial [Myxococcales bacterium]
MVSKKEKYLAAAQKFIERGQADKALAEYAKVVQEDSKDTRTWLKMAELHAKRGANTEASDIYLRTGDLYVEQGFAQKAVAVYKNVLKLSPGTVPAHLKVAALFNQLGLVSDAIQQFEMAATALQRAGKPADAVTALRQAVELQPENVVLRVKVAEAASHAGMVEDAVREFATAADQLKAQGRGDEASRVLERLLFHQPDNHAKARELAELYIAKGTPRLALPKLQGCLNGDPRDPHTLSLLAKALEQLGQAAKAVSVLKELVRVCDELGRSTERDAAVLRGLTLDPSDGELLATARRYQVRAGAGAAAGEATPPPLLAGDSAASSGDGSGRDETDGDGVELGGLPGGGPLSSPLIVGEASGRVLATLGVLDSERRDWAGMSSGTTPEVGRILAEAEVFVKYGLLERAADHLPRIFDIEPDHREGREKLIGVLQRLGRHEAAGRHAEIL